MRIHALILALAALVYVGCSKTDTTPDPVAPVEPESMKEEPDTTRYPLVGDYAWRVVTHQKIRGGSTTIEDVDLTIRFSPDNARFTYNGGAISNHPASYNGDTVRITFPGEPPTIFWKSLHKVKDKYEWHLEEANCHCVSSSENYDVYFLRR